MLIIQVCVGSSCHLKGAPDIVEMLQKEIAERHLENDIVLTGCFCAGKCNRAGVTVIVNDDIYTGITKESFYEFFNEKILKLLEEEKKNS